jgi:hypothetical protein
MGREYMNARHFPEYPQEKRDRYLAEGKEWIAYFADMYERVMLGGGEEWEREFIGVDLEEEEDEEDYRDGE